MNWFRALFTTPLWQIDHPLQHGVIGSRVLKISRIFAFAWKSFWADELLIRATALAYATILSIVPLLAVAFSLYTAFPGLNDAHMQMRALIYQYLAAGASEAVIDGLDNFIANVHSGAIAGAGLVVLFVIVIFLLGAIEYSFNIIWSVRRSRRLVDRIVYYIAIVIVGPLLIGLSLRTFVNSILKEFAVFGFVERNFGAEMGNTIFALSVSIVAITALYVVVPNTRVRWRAALAGGVVAGIAFEVAKTGYTYYVTNLINYSAIYGAVGAIPVFFVWVYLIWLVVLFGAEFAYAWQNVDVHRLKLAHRDTSQAYREWLAVSMLVEVTRKFVSEEPGPTVQQLALQFSVPEDLAHDLLDRITAAGLIADSARGLLPGREPDLIRLADVVMALRNRSAAEERLQQQGDPAVTAALKNLESKLCNEFGGITVRQLASAKNADEIVPSSIEKNDL